MALDFSSRSDPLPQFMVAACWLCIQTNRLCYKPTVKTLFNIAYMLLRIILGASVAFPNTKKNVFIMFNLKSRLSVFLLEISFRTTS